MRFFSRAFLAGCFAALLSVSGVFTQDAVSDVEVQAGADLPMSIMTLLDDVVSCSLLTPHGETVEFKPEDKSGDRYTLRGDTLFSKCDISVSNIGVNDAGSWTLRSQNSDGSGQTQGFRVTVVGSDSDDTSAITTTDHIVEVTYKDPINYEVSTGDVVLVEMTKVGYRETDACRLQTPHGQTHDLNDQLHVNGVEIINDDKLSCGVEITVNSEELVGHWELISEESSMGSHPVERRQPFSIAAVEYVNTIPKDSTTIVKGAAFHIRLEKEAIDPSSCVLIGPSDDVTRISRDPDFTNLCGFIVSNVSEEDQGVWTISYGAKILYKAEVSLTVQDSSALPSEVQTLSFTVNQPAQSTLGPEDAVYCRLVDPRGHTHFEGFGRCKLNVPRTTTDLTGYWHIFAYSTGKILAEEYVVNIRITDQVAKPVVSTTVDKVDRVVYLTCAVSTTQSVRGGKFRDPVGRVLLAGAGVGEGRYTAGYTQTKGESGATTHEFSLRISEPEVSEMGIWRCAIDAEMDTFYGFATVLCPWAMQDPAVAAAVVSEPTLTAEHSEVSAVASDEVNLSCTVSAPIRYCYFRYQNGSVYTVNRPGQLSTSFEYSGAGLDAGECGMRVKHLSVSDSGTWSCHVGLYGEEAEQSANIHVKVAAKFWVLQYEDPTIGLVVKGNVTNEKLEYCRFVRMDGFGFTSDHIPPPYLPQLVLQESHCGFSVPAPSVLDHHPWTVVAKIQGHDEELTATTDHTLHSLIPGISRYQGGRILFILCILMLVPLSVLVVTSGLRHRHSRAWLQDKSSFIRSTVTRSFRVQVKAEALPAKDAQLV